MMKSRIYFLDNLRTFAIFLVILIHTGIVYEQILENNWIVSDPAKSSAIGLVRMYLDLFVMYTIFFISGYFVPISLKKKGAMGVLKSKTQRILWPWVLAVFTLIPAYKIIFLYSREMPQEAWYSYFHLYQRAGSDLGIFSNNPNQNWLWFLPILWLFQVLYLALSKINLSPIKISLKVGVILTIMLGVIYSMLISNAHLTGWFHSGFLEFQRERLLPYFMVFLLGALCQKKQVFETKKNVNYFILANVVLTISLAIFTTFSLNLFFNLIEPGRQYFFISDSIDRTVYYFSALLSMFSFLYVLLYVFRFNFNKTSPLLDQLNKNSYSIYIIHVVVIGALAIVMVHLQIPASLKYLMLTALTFALSNFLVNLYDRLKWKNRPIKITATTLFVVAFFVITSSGDRKGTKAQGTPTKISQSKLSPPSIRLHEAIIQGNIEAVRQHIQAGSDLDKREPTGGSSPLITAAVFGKTEIALLLIENGADIDFQNNEGSTPLITAAFFGRVKTVQALLAKGADQQIKNKAGSTALDAVVAPFEAVKEIYDRFQYSLGSLGLQLDYEQLQRDRPRIAKMLGG